MTAFTGEFFNITNNIVFATTGSNAQTVNVNKVLKENRKIPHADEIEILERATKAAATLLD